MTTTFDSSRVEAFSDGVLAIAITLLVLDLHVSTTPGSVATALVEQWPEYLAYVASFIYIGVIWVNHHAMFRRIARVDPGLLWVNLTLLLAASVLPFPTAQLAFAMNRGTHQDQEAALVLYAAVSAAVGASWLLTFEYLHRRPQLLRAEVPRSFYRAERVRASAGIAAPFVPVVIGLWQPLLGLVVIALTPIFYAATAGGPAAIRDVERDSDGAQP